jgi:translation initiation factor IF-1
MKKDLKSLIVLMSVFSLTICFGCASSNKNVTENETPDSYSKKDQNKIELYDKYTVTADILEIDKKDRILKVRKSDGDIVDLKVGEYARNFDQIKAGDHIKVEYYDSVTVYIGEPGDKIEESLSSAIVRAPKGDMPAGSVAEVHEVAATIEAIDKTERILSLALPDGKKITTKVNSTVKGLDKLKVGDSIRVRIAEAISISVESP